MQARHMADETRWPCTRSASRTVQGMARTASDCTTVSGAIISATTVMAAPAPIKPIPSHHLGERISASSWPPLIVALAASSIDCLPTAWC